MDSSIMWEWVAQRLHGRVPRAYLVWVPAVGLAVHKIIHVVLPARTHLCTFICQTILLPGEFVLACSGRPFAAPKLGHQQGYMLWDG